MKKCIIVGAGTYGQVYAKYLSEEYDILGYVDDDEDIINQEIEGYKVLGTVGLLFEPQGFDLESTCVFVPIGNNLTRNQLLNRISSFGYETPSFIHKTVILDSTVEINDPVYILPGTNIMPFTKIARNVMISMGVNIAHHVIIAEGCFFSQGSNVGASIVIEDLAYMGIASTLMTGVKRIGENSLVGAGAVVIKDVPAHVVVAGVPAKIIKTKNSVSRNERQEDSSKSYR